MKHLALLLYLVSFISTKTDINPQQNSCKRYYDKSIGAYVYEFSNLDELPEYPGGQRALYSFLFKKIKYPPEQTDLQSEVTLAFIIDTLGNTRNAEIYNKLIKNYSALDKEILRCSKLMSKWKPGMCNGKKVPVRLTIPLRIEVQM